MQFSLSLAALVLSTGLIQALPLASPDVPTVDQLVANSSYDEVKNGTQNVDFSNNYFTISGLKIENATTSKQVSLSFTLSNYQASLANLIDGKLSNKNVTCQQSFGSGFDNTTETCDSDPTGDSYSYLVSNDSDTTSTSLFNLTLKHVILLKGSSDVLTLTGMRSFSSGDFGSCDKHSFSLWDFGIDDDKCKVHQSQKFIAVPVTQVSVTSRALHGANKN